MKSNSPVAGLMAQPVARKNDANSAARNRRIDASWCMGLITAIGIGG
jgi:hypothetical protein